jgi:hypothetical protein
VEGKAAGTVTSAVSAGATAAEAVQGRASSDLKEKKKAKKSGPGWMAAQGEGHQHTAKETNTRTGITGKSMEDWGTGRTFDKCVGAQNKWAD